MKKESYETPEMEIIPLEKDNDVITSSCGKYEEGEII